MGSKQSNPLAGFEAIWQRVTGSAEAPETTQAWDDISVLVRFIEATLRSVRLYTGLSAYCGGPVRNTLLRLASEERRRFKQLQTELFLLSGDNCAPQMPPERSRGMLSALRSAYNNERVSAEAYMSSAGHTQSDRLRALYLRSAAEERHHAETLRRLIQRALG
ncbi:MAG: hypothetical protein Q4A39_00195 [Eubacteriales bacterium]|nr:hypothetical protein [Eubacteriales bacterium]